MSYLIVIEYLTGNKKVINSKHTMITYISLLRGINVRGQKIIRMEALRNLDEKLGFKM
jgi:hypothetical protein